MIAEIGLIALILATLFSLLIGVIPLLKIATKNIDWLSAAKPLAYSQLVFIGFAFFCLILVFCLNDFSVIYVANNSSALLPTYYKISATWGGHEGSLLLWAVILSIWNVLFAYKSDKLPIELSATTIAILGWISFSFLIIILFSSNPFERNLPFPPNSGMDLNPLLQDFAMIIHPPILYTGYVGFSIPFAFSCAILLARYDLNPELTKWIRSWATASWIFLTLGITLGSWWAYYELGWGGWWFWDPVENASFIPWLIGVSLIHSLAITEKRKIFKSWTILLSFFAFIFTIVGTFLVRSGVVSSVHSFASDPKRGMFLLVFLAITIICSLLLFIFRPQTNHDDVSFSWWSRETMLLANNWLLIVAAIVILFGTIFPLIIEALGLGSVSVGAPYFNAVFIPLMLVTSIFLGLGILLSWKKNKSAKIFLQMKKIAILCLVISIVLLWSVFNYDLIYQGLASFAISWVIACCILDIKNKLQYKKSITAITSIKLSYWGMQLAHLGFAISMIGVLATSTFSLNKDVALSVAETTHLGNYSFKFTQMEQQTGVNYTTNFASVDVYYKQKYLTTMHPEKRFYQNNIPITETSINAGFWRDLYIALGEPLASDNNSWSLRIQIKTMIRWIWLGGLLMIAGAILSILSRRLLIKKTAILDNNLLQDIK